MTATAATVRAPPVVSTYGNETAYRWVDNGGHDLDVADGYHALAHYHDHPREMREGEGEREDDVDAFRETIQCPAGVDPDTT